MPGLGEIYQVLAQSNREIAIASYSGLHFGKINIGKEQD